VDIKWKENKLDEAVLTPGRSGEQILRSFTVIGIFCLMLKKGKMQAERRLENM